MVRWSRHRRGWLAIALVIIAIVALTGCDAPQTTFSPKTEAAQRIQTVYILVIILASMVMLVVMGALVYALIRFRSRPGREASQVRGNHRLETAWTIAPALVLVVIAVPTVLAIASAAEDPGPDALQVHVVAHQWWWEVQYPGLGPEDPENPDIRLPLVTANEIHLPLGREVSITLESADVVHSFWVPQLVGKVDAFPGHESRLPAFTPQEVGVFFGQCAEFCGLSHANMKFRVIVDSLGDFNRWVQALQTPPDPPTGLAAQGQQLFMGQGGCLVCHTVAGTAAQGKIGPDLTRFGARLTLGAGILDNTPENLGDWISNLQAEKPGALFMPIFEEQLSPQEIDALAAYLRSMQVE